MFCEEKIWGFFPPIFAKMKKGIMTTFNAVALLQSQIFEVDSESLIIFLGIRSAEISFRKRIWRDTEILTAFGRVVYLLCKDSRGGLFL